MDVVRDFDVLYCRGNVLDGDYKYDLKINGKIEEQVAHDTIRYIAASPGDFHQSYTGSGLPFANQVQAFDNTPNKGIIKLDASNSFSINVMLPNSYYVGLGSVLIGPTLYLHYENSRGESRVVTILLAEPTPYRLLTYPMSRKNVNFYDVQFLQYPRSQETILRKSGYPCINHTPKSFWGGAEGKPPM